MDFDIDAIEALGTNQEIQQHGTLRAIQDSRQTCR